MSKTKRVYVGRGRVVRHRSDPAFIGRGLLYAGISALVGVVHPGASLAKPIGVSEVGLGLLQIVIAVGAALVPLLWMLRGTRLQTDDLRITVPAPWSPAFCLPVFLGVASTANLCGGLLVRLAGAEDAATLLPSGGAELFVCSFGALRRARCGGGTAFPRRTAVG